MSGAIRRFNELDHTGRSLGSGRSRETILITGEKPFTVEQAHNAKMTSQKSPMVWDGIYVRGKTPLIFLDQGVKINKEEYRRQVFFKSGDLYSLWPIMEARTCAKPHKSLKSLENSLRRKWD